MTSALITWLLSFAATLGKSILKAASPVILGEVKELCGAAYDLAEDELNSTLSAEEKQQLVDDSVNVARTAWDVAKKEGALLKEDTAGLLAQAAASEVKDVLGIN